MNFDSSVLNVAIEDIIPNRSQPRLAFDDASLSDLAKSIKEHGIIQPLVLRKFGDKYEIVAGERRYKAAQLAGLASVPAVVALIDDKTSAEVAIAENVQRKPLTAIEEAKSYKALLDLGYMSEEQLAGKMGISVTSLSAKLQLLTLPAEVQDGIMAQKISERHGRSLLMIPDADAQIEWFHKTIDERLTVRQLDEKIKEIYKGETTNMNLDIDAIKQNSHDIEPMRPVETPSNSAFDYSAPIDLGQKQNGKFFNNLENTSANMEMTEAINPLAMGDNTPNLGFGTSSQNGLSFASVDTSTPAPTFDAPVMEDPTVLPSIPAVGGMTPVMPGDTPVQEASIDSLESLDFEPPVEQTIAPAVDATPGLFDAQTLNQPEPAFTPSFGSNPLFSNTSETSNNTLSPEEAKNKINNLINELKASGYNIDMTTADLGDQTLFNIILKK